MSFFTHFHLKGNNIFLRWVDDSGVRRNTVIKDYAPDLYVKTHEETEFSSLYGDPVKPVHFENIKDAKEFLKRYEDVKGFEIFGNTLWEYAAVADRFKGKMEYDETKILTYYFDIETEVGETFPDPYVADQRINVLTIFDGSMYRVWNFQHADVEAEYNGYQVDQRTFKNEEMMLRDFMRFWTSNYPDVLTGWNSERFDVPYLINRIRNLFGEDRMKSMSPVDNIREYLVDQKATAYEIKGVEHLDYMNLFKKFMPGERDFSLDAVAEDILRENKLENPESSFKLFYQKHWDTFCAYNIHDVGLIYKLEEKLKLLSLAFSLAYLVKMNYSDAFGTVRPWDVFIQNHLKETNRFVKAVFSPATLDRQIAGGFVADPIPGRYQWVVSFDANSLYPSIVRSFNISPETILNEHEVPEELLPWYDKIHGQELTDDIEKLNPLLQKHNLSMTANGQFFKRDRAGVLPELMGYVYNGRVQAKNEMKKFKKLLEDETDESKKEEYEREIAALDNRQSALKILINSGYGAQANAYFRFFDFRCAEGITTTGQYFIQRVAKETGDWIDKVSQSSNSVNYIDTDSNYFTLRNLLEKACLLSLPKPKLIDAIDKICEEKIGPKIARTCADIASDLNLFENHLAVKREKICESAVWVAKKRYALLAWDNEGIRYHEPHVAVTGLEVKRSSTPALCRKALNEALKVFLSGTEPEIQELVKKVYDDFMKEPLQNIAVPSGVKGLDKYEDAKSIYKQGCPQHVRATLLYNHFLKTHKVEAKYNPILEGGKMRRVPLTLPNPIGEDVIGFIDRLPEEFGLHEYIDYEELFQKTFMQALDRICAAVNWSSVKKNTLDDFFA